jgi:ribosomal protein S18 acetylase RimI-like enzyme
MITLRALRWPDDREHLLALDTSYTTERIYHVVAAEQSFVLEDTPTAPAFSKAYALADHLDYFPTYDRVVVAEIDTTFVGVAALNYESWNRRAVLWHLYVAAAYRGCGVGRALIDDIVRAAQEHQARCVWLETQNTNYGAIQFYRRAGFQCCGLDLSLYDSEELAAGEIALFFARQLV